MMTLGSTDDWMDAFLAVRRAVAHDPEFPALVRAGNHRRARRIANRICDRLGLPRAVWRGNVYGAAQDARDLRSIARLR